MLPVRLWAVTLTSLLAVVPIGEAAAGPATDQLKGAVDRVVKVVEDPSLKGGNRLADRRAAVRTIAQDIFDFPEVARRALARHWQPLTEKQREEFTALLGDLLERSYVSRIELYGGEKISYANERLDGDTATVATRITTRSGTEIPVDYRLIKKGDKWLVYDVNIEGVSLVANYRTQFNKIIQTSSYNDLIQKLKTKQDEVVADEQAKDKKPAPAKK